MLREKLRCSSTQNRHPVTATTTKSICNAVIAISLGR
jgi:hypothetical protein